MEVSVLWQNFLDCSSMLQFVQWFCASFFSCCKMVQSRLHGHEVGDLKIFGTLSMAEDEGLKLLVKSIQVFSGGREDAG